MTELVPLWRFNEDNRAGGFEVTIYGYDFMTSAQASGSARPMNATTTVWYRAEYNQTSGTFRGTPCETVSTSYTKIVCRVRACSGNTNADSDIALAVTVDGQTALSFVSQNAVAKAKLRVTSGSYTQDDELITSLSDERKQAFQAQIDRCMDLSDGLVSAWALARRYHRPQPSQH